MLKSFVAVAALLSVAHACDLSECINEQVGQSVPAYWVCRQALVDETVPPVLQLTLGPLQDYCKAFCLADSRLTYDATAGAVWDICSGCDGDIEPTICGFCDNHVGESDNAVEYCQPTSAPTAIPTTSTAATTTTDEPTTDEPTTDEPTTDEPTTEEILIQDAGGSTTTPNPGLRVDGDDGKGKGGKNKGDENKKAKKEKDKKKDKKGKKKKGKKGKLGFLSETKHIAGFSVGIVVIAAVVAGAIYRRRNAPVMEELDNKIIVDGFTEHTPLLVEDSSDASGVPLKESSALIL